MTENPFEEKKSIDSPHPEESEELPPGKGRQAIEQCHVCGISDEAEDREIIHIALTGDGSVTVPMCQQCAPLP